MAISTDHSTAPVHAHLNLLGWVSLFLMGIYYKLHEEIDGLFLARIQAIIWAAASLLIALGIALIHMNNPVGDPIAAVMSIVLFLDMILFVVLVAKSRQ
ncbi:hypothetical protein [Celeribacter litoreus]|uniref:hypothetical protein n=1 Tax=Celeribacter litoreus TaxID=2876714 RepID=UPI001CCCF734|nr:hypothetical protein [Celeribacter litoreus]